MRVLTSAIRTGLIFWSFFSLLVISRPSPVSAATYTGVVSGPNDTTYTGTIFSSNAIQTILGTDVNVPVYHFLLFENVEINRGSTINSAVFSATLTEAIANTVRVRIRASNVGNAVAPTNASEFTTKQNQLTEQYVDWQVPSGSFGASLSSPDLVGVVQAVINREDWTAGNSIMIYISENGSDAWSGRRIAGGAWGGSEPKPSLSIDYQPINLAPVAVDDSFSVNEQISLNVLENDSDADGDSLSLAELTTPEHGTASIENNEIVYVPSAGYVGNDSFVYTISDGQGHSDTATVTVTVLENPLYYSYSFDIDRSSVPTLYYNDLSLKVHLGTVSSVSVTLEGQLAPFTYDNVGGDVYFTTPNSGHVQIKFKNPTKTSGFTVSKLALKDNKKFAWSHGLDDNTFLKAQIDLIKAKGWRASLFLIGQSIDDTRDEDWIVDKPEIVRLLADGWNMGNHTWGHDCYVQNIPTDEEIRTTILQGFNRVQGIIDSSLVPNHRQIAFAAPCFESVYNSYINAMRSAQETTVLYNESAGASLMIVNPDASSYSASSKTAEPVSGQTTLIGRDTVIESAPTSANAILDWMNTNAASNRHFWYNTLTHGNQETNLAVVLNYAYSNYGPGGSGVMWMAPSDEIYSYLLVRDNAQIANADLTQLSDGSGLTISNITSSTTNNSAVINWNTDREANSQVYLGLTTAVSDSLPTSSTLTTSHAFDIIELVPCTRYYYKVRSTDDFEGSKTSSVGYFDTSGCVGSASIDDFADETIPTSGGSLSLMDNDQGVSLIVPSSFSSQAATFQAKKLAVSSVLDVAPVPDGLSVVGSSMFDLKALVNTMDLVSSFDNPVTVSLTYLPEDIAGLDESELKIYRFDGVSWDQLSNCSVDASVHTVTCQTEHFSVFALFGAPPTVEEVLIPVNNSNTVAVSSNSGSSSGSRSPACVATKPGKVPDLFQINAFSRSARLFFTPLSDTSSYYVSFSTSPNAEEHGALVTLAREGVQNFSVSFLKPNTTYFFKVRGQNGCVPGEWSNTLMIRTNNINYYRYFPSKPIFGNKIAFSETISKNAFSQEKTITVTPTPDLVQKPSVIPTIQKDAPAPRVKEGKRCFLWWCW